MNISNIIQDLDYYDKQKEDRVVDLSEFRFNKNVVYSGNETFSLTKHATNSLMNLIGIPNQFYEKLRAYPTLLDQNVNTFLQAKPREQLLRLYKSPTDCLRIRGILSRSYLPLDNKEVILPISQTIESEGCDVDGFKMDDEYMLLDAVLPKFKYDIKPNDPVQIGFRLVNSEVGCSSLKVITFIKRLICSNGMTVRDEQLSYSRVHRGSSSNMFSNRAAIREAINNIKAISNNMLNAMNYVHALRASTELPIDLKDEVKRRLNKEFNITNKEISLIEVKFNNEDQTKYGLINSITDYAKQADTERRMQLEQKAGNILTLSAKEWSRLVA